MCCENYQREANKCQVSPEAGLDQCAARIPVDFANLHDNAAKANGGQRRSKQSDHVAIGKSITGRRGSDFIKQKDWQGHKVSETVERLRGLVVEKVPTPQDDSQQDDGKNRYKAVENLHKEARETRGCGGSFRVWVG